MKRRSGFGWLELAIGLLLLLLGGLTLTRPDFLWSYIAIIYGVSAIMVGIADILLYIRLERFTGFGPVLALVAGILSVMAGIMLMGHPEAGSALLAILVPVWFIAHCISGLLELNHIRLASSKGMYYFTLVIHILGLCLGVLMFLRPIFTLEVIRFIAGAYLLLLGIDAVVLAFSRVGRRF